MKEIVYYGEDDKIRLDKYLARKEKTFSRNLISENIKKGKIKLNGKVVKPSYLLKNMDSILIEEISEKKIELKKENIKLDIVYEDDSIILLNKPKNMLVHPSANQERGTLVNALLNYTDKLSNEGEYYRPGIVHRLDKDTSGLMVVAKDNRAYRSLTKQFSQRSVERSYLALVEGRIKEKEAWIDQPIGRDPKDRRRMTVIKENSKEAKTKFKVLESFENYTLIEASLYTGRMHQIRVHMSHIGHPIVGDSVYGQKDRIFNLDSQFLHAYRLSFQHPEDGEKVSFTSKLPNRFKDILEKIRLEEGKNV